MGYLLACGRWYALYLAGHIEKVGILLDAQEEIAGPGKPGSTSR
jgi:hypothetical protein